MKIIILQIIICLFLTSCNWRTQPIDLDKVREDFAREAELSNARNLDLENLIDSIYDMSGADFISATNTIDNLIRCDSSLDQFQISRLHFIKGDICYAHDSLQMAVDEFTRAGQATKMGAPKYLAARAGAYIKLKQFEKAFADLNKAAGINHDYLWNIGNYHEIRGNRDSALFYYHQLYAEDTVVCKKCIERINELKNPKTKPLKELIYTDRNTSVILINGIQ